MGWKISLNPISRDEGPEKSGYLSQSTGLEFRVVDDNLRIFVAHGGSILPTPAEYAARAEARTGSGQLATPGQARAVRTNSSSSSLKTRGSSESTAG